MLVWVARQERKAIHAAKELGLAAQCGGIVLWQLTHARQRATKCEGKAAEEGRKVLTARPRGDCRRSTRAAR